ncbi:MAG: hypothetical protein U1C46_09895 [Bacteroidales bacterium]|nr:hypothetical protein [Bacteroidales bacterium]
MLKNIFYIFIVLFPVISSAQAIQPGKPNNNIETAGHDSTKVKTLSNTEMNKQIQSLALNLDLEKMQKKLTS